MLVSGTVACHNWCRETLLHRLHLQLMSVAELVNAVDATIHTLIGFDTYQLTDGPHPEAMQQAADALATRELYGGAVMMQLPSRFHDVSNFRPVPDHQEVWADPNEDQSLVMEVVEHNPMISDADCARHYWEDQVHCNQATSSSMNGVHQLGPIDVAQIPSGCIAYGCIIEGIQIVSKARQSVEAANQVLVMLSVLRMPHVKSDLLITLNSPMIISPSSQAAEHAGAGVKHSHHSAPTLMQQMLSSLTVADWKLFG